MSSRVLLPLALAAMAACKGEPSVGRAEAGVVDASTTADVADAAADRGPAKASSGMPTDLNVLLISVDSLRADMPWTGYARPIAPRLTELEKKSVDFTRAYSISSYTSMSLGGMLAGKLPSGLKRSGFFFGSYPAENLFFPELLQKAGVRTMSAHAHSYFKDSGFNQGFDQYELVPNLIFKNETDPNVTSEPHEQIAERLLGDPALDSKRFFAWFHFLDPHDQYVSHEKDGIPAYGKTLRDRYDAEVLYTDRYLGKLIDFVASKSWGKRTAIILTADHGEAFGDHGVANHGFEVYENLVRVPLFFVMPGVTPRKIDLPRSTIDLAPTICELLGVAPDPGFEGTSLVKQLYGGPDEPRDVFVDLPMTSDSDKRRAVIHGHEKVIAFGVSETLRYFDLDADPDEKSPITSGPKLAELAAIYKERSKTITEIVPFACGVGCLNRAYANKK